jgi:hypothetical protein
MLEIIRPVSYCTFFTTPLATNLDTSTSSIRYSWEGIYGHVVWYIDIYSYIEIDTRK